MDYPYGGVVVDLGTYAASGQPYKFGGRELINVNGLNKYNFGSSAKNSARICRFPFPSG